ncbi:MAG: hypothetical protein IJX17_05525 [Clostridia bacterium]|nr:hypothetical protein [Clostridia bacterium]
MNFEELNKVIFENFEEKHKEILTNYDLVSRKKAEEILAKYDTTSLTDEEIETIKSKIIQIDIDDHNKFIEENKDIVDSSLSHQEKMDKLMSKYSNSNMSEQEQYNLKCKLSRYIFDNEVNKTLLNLVQNIKKLPKEEQDAFWGKDKK